MMKLFKMDHHANNFKKTYCNNLFQDNFCKFIIYAKITSTECRITQKWNYSLKISRINNVGYNKIQRLIWIIPVASVYLSNIMRVVVVCWFLFSTRLTETQHNGRSTQLLPLSQSMQGYWIQYFWILYCFFTHLWFCCLVKGSSCFAPLRFSVHISLFWLRGDWVFVTFPADLHWLQFQRVQL